MSWSLLAAGAGDLCSAELIDLWTHLAPGETTHFAGRALPARPQENPPSTRITEITRPQLECFFPPEDRRTGASVLICPGGAYRYVVVDKEGSEAAGWLNNLGVAAFVLRYRTRSEAPDPTWRRPLQDAQRALRLIRARAQEWRLATNEIGIMGFSAGGQIAALAASRSDQPSYDTRDGVDAYSCRPAFALLIYPWDLVNDRQNGLREFLTVDSSTSPTFMVHAHDDHATSLSSALFYAELLKHGVPAELHIFPAGGHGYGLRPVPGATVHRWPDLAADWLRWRGLVEQ